MAAPAVADRAAFYRAALWLGLVSGAEVVAWAEALLAAAPDASPALVDLAVMEAHDVTGLRHALLRLGPERPPWPVVQAVFALAGRQLASGRRSLGDTCTVLRQARQWLPLPGELADELKRFELARMGDAGGDVSADLDAAVRAWLASHAGHDAGFTAS